MGSSLLCDLCVSPYCSEIVSAKKQGMMVKILFEKYAPLMGYKSPFHAFEVMLWRHIKKGHKSDAVLTVTPPGSALPVKRATLENYSKRMLSLGLEKAENTTSDTVSFKDVNQAIKLSLEASKIKIAENALELQMNKMFGSEIDPNKVIDGQVEEEDGLRRIG